MEISNTMSENNNWPMTINQQKMAIELKPEKNIVYVIIEFDFSRQIGAWDGNGTNNKHAQ